MKIAGIQKCSMVDYPQKMAAVIFTRGCNLDCYFCHNHWLISHEDDAVQYREEDVLAFLEKRVGLLDAVVISGGEPTLQADLEDFLRKVRALGYPIKLDTNGTRPDVLARLIEEGLVDFVAMDVKAPRARYEEICGPVDTDAIDASIQMLLMGYVDYEFRTTLAPELSDSDVRAIAQWTLGARSHVLQQFRPLDPESPRASDARVLAQPHAADRVQEWVGSFSDAVMMCHSRGLGSDFKIARVEAPGQSVAPHCAWPRGAAEAPEDEAELGYAG